MLPPLGPLGPAVAGRDVTAADWAATVDPARRPLVLAPAGSRGWFGGTPLLALDPVSDSRHDGDGLAAVGAAADGTMASAIPQVTAALMEYEGAARVLTYRGGLVLANDAWHTWGSAAPPTPPEPASAGVSTIPDQTGPLATGLVAEMDEAAFVAGVENVREAVARGDVYVLNLTYRLRGVPALPSGSLFAALAARAGGDMAAALVTPDGALASVSPERFVAIDGGEARIQPIKGTRPRGATREEDEALAEELAASAKERAEHVMIVDLERNDLGRVSVPGGVTVDPLTEIVPLPYCHQMVSTVRGTLRGDIGVGDVLDATFPCGSVTGAPKISAMEHIRALEVSPRGAYCGALVVAVPGAMDSSVLIRTAEISGDALSYGTGGGITHDSIAAEEWHETLVKAHPLTGGA